MKFVKMLGYTRHLEASLISAMPLFGSVLNSLICNQKRVRAKQITKHSVEKGRVDIKYFCQLYLKKTVNLIQKTFYDSSVCFKSKNCLKAMRSAGNHAYHHTIVQ